MEAVARRFGIASVVADELAAVVEIYAVDVPAEAAVDSAAGVAITIFTSAVAILSFSKEVADLAFAYLVMLSRHVIKIHNHVLLGEWIKPPGISLSGKNVALVGYGDIGKNLSKHLHSAEMNVHVYEVDSARTIGLSDASLRVWPESISEMDAIVLACALTPENSEMIDREILSNLKKGALIVNVSRGGLINEVDLVEALNSGRLGGVALDVFQVEPLPSSSRLRKCENVILGTHNASNTSEAVIRTSLLSIDIMNKFFREI